MESSEEGSLLKGRTWPVTYQVCKACVRPALRIELPSCSGTKRWFKLGFGLSSGRSGLAIR